MTGRKHNNKHEFKLKSQVVMPEFFFLSFLQDVNKNLKIHYYVGHS